MLDSSDPGCVSGDTEFLTPTGWKRIDQYVPGDMVAQFHPHVAEIEFVEPIAYVKEPCAEMIEIAPVRGTSQLLSPEHRVLWYGPNEEFGEQSAESFMRELHKRGGGHMRKKFMTAMHTAATNTTGMSEAELRVQVAFVADGHMAAKTPGSLGTIRVKKTRKVERLHKLLQDARIQYRHRTQPSTGFTIFRFTPPRHFKHFPAAYHALKQKELCIIGDEATHWDGSFDPRPSSGRRFSSMVKTDADIVQLAWAALGASTSNHWTEHGGYQVHASLKQLVGPGRKEAVRVVPSPDGYKYCFTVPSTYLYLRRNGYPFATGNTGKTRVQIELFAARRKRGGGAALVGRRRRPLDARQRRHRHRGGGGGAHRRRHLRGLQAPGAGALRGVPRAPRLPARQHHPFAARPGSRTRFRCWQRPAIGGMSDAVHDAHFNQ